MRLRVKGRPLLREYPPDFALKRLGGGTAGLLSFEGAHRRHPPLDPHYISHNTRTTMRSRSLTPLVVASSALAFGDDLTWNRRDVIHQTQAVVLGLLNTAPLVANAVPSPYCANGEGSDCDRLAGGNEYIKSLQRQSIENKAANQRVRREEGQNA